MYKRNHAAVCTSHGAPTKCCGRLMKLQHGNGKSSYEFSEARLPPLALAFALALALALAAPRIAPATAWSLPSGDVFELR